MIDISIEGLMLGYVCTPKIVMNVIICNI